MSKLITLAVFNNAFDIKFNLLKNMLEEADIKYITTNENTRVVEPVPYMMPTNLSIEVKIYDYDVEEAVNILKSIN